MNTDIVLECTITSVRSVLYDLIVFMQKQGKRLNLKW